MSAHRSGETAGAVPGPDRPALPAGPAGPADAAIARQVRARALVAGAEPAAIAAQIVRRCGTSRIRARRLALGIALADVVAQVRARYEADGRPEPRFSETLLSAYEGGQKRPGPEYLHYLCAVYHADPADLGFAGRCLCGQSHQPPARPGPAGAPRRSRPGGPSRLAPVLVPVPERTPVPQAAGPVLAPAARGAIAHEDDELRNMLLRQMAEPATQVDSGFLGAVDRIRRRMDEVLLGGTVSASMIDRWEEGTASYGRQYMIVPPQRLLCDVLLDFADVRRTCEDRQPLEFAERLCRLASQLAGLAGIAMLDLGDHRLARSFFRTARTAADETGDRHLRAWVTVREALVPLYYGDPREAATLAGAASDLAGRQLCVAAAMAPVIEARAQARLSALTTLGPRARRELSGRVRASLDRAHDVLGDLPDDLSRDTALGYTERQLYFHTGDTLVALGDWQAASRAFSQAGQLYATSEVLDGALIALGQARCLLESDEPGLALAAGQRILSQLPAEHRTEVVLQVARALGHQAAGRDPALAALAGYREALATA
jgi:hypothetical protein